LQIKITYFPRNQINESDGNSSVAYLVVVVVVVQQQQRNLQSGKLAQERALSLWTHDSSSNPNFLLSRQP
jgi:hypothetical protein